MSATPMILALLFALLAALGIYLWRQWQIARRTTNVVSRLLPALTELTEFYALLERSTDRSHFMERHGPILQRLEVQGRALTGSILYSGLAGKAVTSARWLTHADLLYAIDSALKHWSDGIRPKGGTFNFFFEYAIGEGYKKGTTTLVQTQHAKVVVKDGEIVTAYPVLEPNTSLQPMPLRGAAEL